VDNRKFFEEVLELHILKKKGGMSVKHKFTIEDPDTQTVGTIVYDDEEKAFNINFSDEDIRRQVAEYLNTRRQYRIPKSQDLDDFEEIEALPTKDLESFTLALNDIYGTCDVWCIKFP
jgi:hypothetical protein